ncbi:hypothetical protein ACC716_33875 [Rhizobium johnstonii]
MSCSTPWGPSQGATVYAEGIVSHTTAGHGGFKLSNDRNGKIHVMLRCAGGGTTKVPRGPRLPSPIRNTFTRYERKSADRTIRDFLPDAWESIFGRIPREGSPRL